MVQSIILFTISFILAFIFSINQSRAQLLPKSVLKYELNKFYEEELAVGDSAVVFYHINCAKCYFQEAVINNIKPLVQINHNLVFQFVNLQGNELLARVFGIIDKRYLPLIFFFGNKKLKGVVKGPVSEDQLADIIKEVFEYPEFR